MQYLTERIKELVLPLFDQKAYDLVDIAIKRDRGRMVLQVLADRPAGGITLDECAGLNSEIGRILDEADLIQESFALEVSSPGLDRPLRQEKDFQRKLDKEIRVFTMEPVNNKIEFAGKLIKVNPEAITIMTDSQEIEIPLSKITKAKEIF
jgi:ribosome maturation factor RimP